jgi:hypothetical protein
MLLEDFNTEFKKSISNKDVNKSREVIMRELGRILVDDKRDFVNLLNESGVEANINDSTLGLIESYAENIPNNKKLMLGSSLLTQSKNKVVGADGSEEISDSGVRAGYEVLKSCFDSESYSNAVDPYTATMEALAKGSELATVISKGQQQKKYGGQQLAAQQTQAKSDLMQSVLDYKKSKTDSKKGKNTIAIVAISGVLVIGIIVAIVAMKRKK